MKDQIILPNRYRAKVSLIKVGDNMYKLNAGNQNDDYMRIGLRDGYTWEDKEYEFIDPPGGPFLCIGYKLDDNTEVDRINMEEIGNKFEYIIRVKNVGGNKDNSKSELQQDS